MDLRVKTGRWIGAAGLLLAVLWTYVYNSGWGYDGLEYLVIGRSMTEGFPFYTFAPSKSFGLYYLVAAYLALPWAATHAGVSVLITALLCTSCIATVLVLRPRFGSQTAIVGSVLVATAGIFMEQIFLLPEGLVFVCGLLAFATATSHDARLESWKWLMAGVWIGVGMAFKIVAVLYGFALVTWIPLASWLAGDRIWPTSARRIAAVAGGIGVALAVPTVFFWLTGRLQPHLEWTYWFPLVDYPARSTWVVKLYTKLLWVWLVLLGAATISFLPLVRTHVFRDGRVWLLISMGSWALLPVLKSQSTHFVFPGAAFLLLYAAIVFDRWAVQYAHFGRRARKPLMAGLALVCLLSGAFYWPRAITRVFGLTSYAREDHQRASLRSLIPSDRWAIFFTQGLRFYWLSDRHPNWPILHTDIQATYLLAQRSTDMLNALDDPQLHLVEFDPRWTAYGDRRFFEDSGGRQFLDQMHARLQRDFRRDDETMAPLVLWIRAADSADND